MSSPPPAGGQVYQENLAKLSHIDDPVDLMERASICLRLLLRRDDDQALLERSSVAIGEVIGDLPFEAPEAELRAHTRRAAQRCIQILQTAQRERCPRSEISDRCEGTIAPEAEEFAVEPEALAAAPVALAPMPEFSAIVVSDDLGEADDLRYCLPAHLSHLLRHLEYETPDLAPAAKGFASFDELCVAAIAHRLDRVLVFFHKHNPRIVRPLPPPFLLSPEFATKFKAAVNHVVIPAIRNSRLMRMLSTSIDHAHTDAEGFWSHLSDGMPHLLLMAWNNAWDELKLVEVRRGEETVRQVKKETKDLRAMLQPSSPSAYDLPHIGNREIELFKSLLDPATDWWPQMAEVWRACCILYEQEKDPRVFQQQAREGALRDMLLTTFKSIPEPWCDFLLLMCHRVFARITTKYLARFTYNIGQDQASRESRMPYVMRYLKQAEGRSEVRALEHKDELHWLKQGAELRNFLKGLPPGTIRSTL